MDEEALSSKVLPFVKKYWLPIALAMFGFVFLGYGLIFLLIKIRRTKMKFSQSHIPQILLRHLL
jgi:hypothetical protein